MGIFASFGVRKLVGDDQGAFGNSYKRALLASKVTLVLDSSVALVQGLAPVAGGRTQQHPCAFSVLLSESAGPELASSVSPGNLESKSLKHPQLIYLHVLNF